MKQLTPKQRRKLAIWVGYDDVNRFRPDSNQDHTIQMIECMTNAPQSDAMIEECQLALCIAALGYMSHHAGADAANAQHIAESATEQ